MNIKYKIIKNITANKMLNKIKCSKKHLIQKTNPKNYYFEKSVYKKTYHNSNLELIKCSRDG